MLGTVEWPSSVAPHRCNFLVLSVSHKFQFGIYSSNCLRIIFFSGPKAMTTRLPRSHKFRVMLPASQVPKRLVDGDLGYPTDQASTGSTSTIPAHTFGDGIRYHKFHDGKYAFPNDQNDQDRDDMEHAMTLILSEKLECGLSRGELVFLSPFSASVVPSQCI